ncbi:hypothetical protein CALCODRAFT_484432 [Calocera cornea HHB12733]|uniref:Uncharacterized protein n=1 Tax=Calocera cornea HHB12733 TaxID=1353952 RepID=A0A165EZZ3_9BASI|nr:hypothetical protein CALCODRAFT_484432 [Calocera cornea HHB12733]
MDCLVDSAPPSPAGNDSSPDLGTIFKNELDLEKASTELEKAQIEREKAGLELEKARTEAGDEKGKGKAAEEVGEGSGESKIKLEVVDPASLQLAIALVKKAKEVGRELTDEEVREVLAASKVNTDDEERAQAAPEDIAADEDDEDDVDGVDAPATEGAVHVLTVDEMRAEGLGEPGWDLLEASPARLEAEAHKRRVYGQKVGYHEQNVRFAQYDAEVADGKKVLLLEELIGEFEIGRAQGIELSRMERVKVGVREHIGNAHARFALKKKKAGQWVKKTAKAAYGATKAFLAKYGLAILKALGLIALAAFLKYHGLGTVTTFLRIIGWPADEPSAA